MDANQTTAVLEPTTDVSAIDDAASVDDYVDEELLVEEVSIDGMCGVY